MTRKDDFAGLKKSAHSLIEGSTSFVVAGTLTGVFGGTYPLLRFTGSDGKLYEEYEQTRVWVDHPIYFIALKGEDGKPVKEHVWTDAEISGLLDSAKK